MHVHFFLSGSDRLWKGIRHSCRCYRLVHEVLKGHQICGCILNFLQLVFFHCDGGIEWL